MADTENIHKISQMGTGGSLAVITDGADFPHTGLIKALNQMSSGIQLSPEVGKLEYQYSLKHL